jgi:hypothetical protein
MTEAEKPWIRTKPLEAAMLELKRKQLKIEQRSERSRKKIEEDCLRMKLSEAKS